MNVHVYEPNAESRFTRKMDCPSCKRPTLMIGVIYHWFGADTTCLRCGRNWKGGEWMPLDFYRYARRDNIRAAKRAYRNAKEETK